MFCWMRLRHGRFKICGKKIPPPPHWHGFRVMPQRIEFWQEQPHRLHDRWVYEKEGERPVGDYPALSVGSNRIKLDSGWLKRAKLP